jgi:hypothetical protein
MRPSEREAATEAARHRPEPMPVHKGPQPVTRVQACPRRPVASFAPGFIPWQMFEPMEHNQKIRSCCRHPENHDVEAYKSNPGLKGPDQFVFICKCGKKHVNWILANTVDFRIPEWK